MWFVYIAEFSMGRLYTGITTNPDRRVFEHNVSKLGAKSLRGKGPVNLLYCEPQHDKISALKREREIKGWKRQKKILLISTRMSEKGLP